jgi:hypothetical protein
MRTLNSVLVLSALVASSAFGQGAIRLSFDSQPSAAAGADPSQVIAARQAQRAWWDSVQVYAEQAFIPWQQAGWRLAAPTGSASYLASIVAVPVPGRPGAYALAVAIMEPGALTNWKYLTHYAAVTASAPEAANTLVAFTIGSIRAAHQPR